MVGGGVTGVQRGSLGLTLGLWGILGDEIWVFGTEVLGAGVMDRSISGGGVAHTTSRGQMVSRDAWTGEAVTLCFGCACLKWGLP